MPSVFFSYSHADEVLRDRLEKQLAMLKRQGIIETWHDRRIVAGEDFAHAIDSHINSDEVILLLVSPDFIASDYCYDVEMTRAMERHEAGEATVIPVILRACEWHPAPFGKLNATPNDGKPVTLLPDIDDAFLQVAKAVRAAAEKWSAQGSYVAPAPARASASPVILDSPRSSNLGLAKQFSQRDKDRFLVETFEYIAVFFENSLSELGQRNPGVEGVFRRIDANRFYATIYRDGRDAARATIFLGGGMLGGINYVQGETMGSNTTNESLSVEADDQSLYVKGMGMSLMSRDTEKKLSQLGAAEMLWDQVIAPLQRRDW